VLRHYLLITYYWVDEINSLYLPPTLRNNICYILQFASVSTHFDIHVLR